jgi:hypothetical protein
MISPQLCTLTLTCIVQAVEFLFKPHVETCSLVGKFKSKRNKMLKFEFRGKKQTIMTMEKPSTLAIGTVYC